MSDTSMDSASGGTYEADNEEKTEEDNFDKAEFKNWIRGVKGLEYLQQGLAPFVDREVAIKHYTFIQGLSFNPQAHGPCNCSYSNLLPDHQGAACIRQNPRKCICQQLSKRRKCPNGICGKIYDFILNEHRFNDPSWKNSDVSEWLNDSWSIAKCFMPDSKSPNDSARSTDAAGLLNIMINAFFFQQKLACNIDPSNDIISQAREYRNELMHKASQELSEQELFTYLDHFMSVLKDPHTLLRDKDAVIAVNNLDKLKKNQIYVGKEEERLIRRKALDCIKQEKERALEDIESAKANALEDINSAKVNALDAILLEKNKVDANTDEKTEDDTEEDAIPLISTDNDNRLDVEDKSIELRDYQLELAGKGSEGKNTIVLAPTNTGKTRVACKIIQDHYRKRSQHEDFGKVIFLVHTEPLAFQQGEKCAEYLPHYRTKVITGRVQREMKHLLKDYIERRDILVVTAQVLLNSLKLKEISSLKEFTLVIIDECHHTIRSHSYNQIMSIYLDMKLQDNFGLPQIVGLTASLGVGGTTVEAAAKEHMKSVMVNLDAHYLSTVKVNIGQLQEYANKAKEYKEIARARCNDRYREAVLDIMNTIDIYMVNHNSMRFLTKADDYIKELCRVPLRRGCEQFSQWISKFNDGIGKLHNDEVIRMMSPCKRHLEIYNKALMLHADARISDSLVMLEEFMKSEKSGNETDEMLLSLWTELTSKNFENEPENPKLEKLKEIIERHAMCTESRCIVFTKTIDLAKAIVNWINSTDSLRKLNARELLGRKRMSRLKQINALKYFKNGRHKVIVATSVAEEGLDVTACNLVIRYEHVKNEIVRLQSRGRARAKGSSYYILTEEGSSLIQKEEELEIREKLMDRILPELSTDTEMNPYRWAQELKAMQKSRNATEQQRERNLIANTTPGVKHLHCFNCNSFICLSTDMRKIQFCHHIAINEDVSKRLIFLRNPDTDYEEENFKSDGNSLCGKCHHSVGGVFELTSMSTEFPLIKIKRVRVVDKSSDERQVFKSWKKVNFKVEQMSFKELERIVLMRDDDYSY